MFKHLSKRLLATGIVVLSLSGVLGTAGAGASGLGTIGGNDNGYGITGYSVVPPRLQGVLCRSSADRVEVIVSGGNVGTFWTNVWYHNYATGVQTAGGWVQGQSSWAIGQSPTRWLNSAVGTWAVYLQIGYFDSAGRFQFVYDQWVPSYGNLYGADINNSWSTPGSTCVVR